MAKLSKTWVFKNFHKTKILTLATLLYLTLPFGLLFLILLHLLRKCAKIIAKITDKKIHSILSPESALLASDDLYGIPSNTTVAWFVLNGNFSGVDHLRGVIYENVICKESTASGSNLLYSQLQQFPVRLIKFMFWKWDEEFNISNHVRYWHGSEKDENKIWSEADVIQLQGNLLRKQWTRNRSLWEVVVVPNYKSSGGSNNSLTSSYHDRELKTVILLRFHESLGDPSTWFRLFLGNLCDCGSERGHIFPNQAHHLAHTIVVDAEKQISDPTIRKPNLDRGVWKCIHERILQPLQFPFHFAQNLLDPENGKDNKHCWSLDEKQLMKRDHFKIIDRFSVQHIKEIKALFGVSFSSVILAAATSALRSTLLSLGQSLPKFISIEFPMMMGDGCQCEVEDRLCSYRSPVLIKLPVGLLTSPKDRLRHCQESYITAKNGKKFPKMHGTLRHLVGLFPVTCFKRYRRNFPWSGTFLNLPGTKDPLSFLDCPIEDVVLASTRESGFTITFQSYVDFIRMSLVIDHRLIPSAREDVAKDLLKSFYSELVLLGIEAIV